MDKKTTPKHQGLSFDGLVTALLVATTIGLFASTYLKPDPLSTEQKARQNAQLIVRAARIAIDQGNHRISTATNVGEIVDLISAGFKVPGPRDLLVTTIQGPEMSFEERRQTIKHLTLDHGVLQIRDVPMEY